MTAGHDAVIVRGGAVARKRGRGAPGAVPG
jgi:hypothetical protein